MKLRPYQELGLEQIIEQFKIYKKVLLHAPTGSGKTVIFCEVLKRVYSKGKRAIMVVRGRKLVDQACNRLIRESVPHGVHMAGHWNRRPYERIQICSIDTLTRRQLFPPADLVVIDEADLFTSPIAHEFFGHYSNSFMLPVTATPYANLPLRHIADTVVRPITIKELIAQGYLVPPRYFAPNIPDLTGVKTQGGDYAKNQLQNVMLDATLVGDLVTHWKLYGQNRPTLAFAVSLAHSKSIVGTFRSNNIFAEHCDADTPDSERQAIIERLERGVTQIVSNVGILCRGVDIPPISCILLARPTKSYPLYIQQTGRGTRPFRGKSDFILLDHAGNCLRHGFIEDELEAQLDGKTKTPKSTSPKVCTECFAVFRGLNCPACGANQSTSKPRKFEVIEGNLKEITPDDEVANYIRELKQLKREQGHKREWIYWKLVDKFGETIAQKYYPKPQIPSWIKSKLNRRY